MVSESSERAVILVLDASLSMTAAAMGSLTYDVNHILSELEYLSEEGIHVVADVLYMGTGDDGEECEWLCGSMREVSEVFDTYYDRFAEGHTPIMAALRAVSERTDALDIPEKNVVVLFVTDGETGRLTASAVGAFMSRVDYSRVVLLTGDTHDEDVIEVLAGSRDNVFSEAATCMYVVMNMLRSTNRGIGP